MMITTYFDNRYALVFTLMFFAIPPMLSAQESAPPAVSAEQQPSTGGLGALLYPLQLDEGTLREQAQAIPQEKKDRVHFFLINGLDPFFTGNLNGMAAYYRSIGFTNTTCYQLHSAGKARRQIESIRRCDPEARIVLLGFSFGANFARSLANDCHRAGMPIDCLVYVGGDTVVNSSSSRPPNVGKVLNIRGHGILLLGRDLFVKGDDIDNAVNLRLDAGHFSIPGQRDTINLVGKELISLARKLPSPSEPPITADRAATLEPPIATPLIQPAGAGPPRK